MSMTSKQASEGVAILIVASPREDMWTDDKVDYYIREFQGWNDYDCFIHACQEVAKTWNWNSPPPIRTVRDAYKSAVRRREMGRPALPSGEKYPHWREGVEIARRAYHAERDRLGLPADDKRFISILARGLTPDWLDAAREQRNRR